MPPNTTQTTTPATSGTRTLYDPSSGQNLSANLNSQFDASGQSNDILSRYQAAQGATQANTQQTGNLIANQYGQTEDYTKLQNGTQQQSALEGRTGFGTNVAMLTNLQAQGAQRVKELTDQANQALMTNNTEGAKALSDLAVNEQTALTTARQNFISNYFGAQTEARAQASFQTPEQAQIMDLAKQYPDANILPTDTQQAAQAKIKASPTYTANLATLQQNVSTAKAQADLYTAQGLAVPQEAKAQLESAQAAMASAGAAQVSAGAQATLAGPQAQQTRMLNDFIAGTAPGESQYISQLENHQITPQQLQNDLSGLPNNAGGAAYNSIMTKARAAGFNENAATLTGTGQNQAVGAMNSGNPVTMFGSMLGQFGNAAGNKVLSGASLANPTIGQTQSVAGTTYQWDGQYWMPK